MASVWRSRVAIVPPGNDQVHLVAAFRSHFALPQPAVGRERESEQVAVADGPELRGDAAPAGPGIARGGLTFGRQPEDLAKVAAHVLGRIEMLALARCQVEEAVRTECNAVREMAISVQLRLLPPDDFEIAQRHPDRSASNRRTGEQ